MSGASEYSWRPRTTTAGSGSLLDLLRSRATIDCDTLDSSIASALGAFKDCTSNQAIAYFELQEHQHGKLVQDSAQLAQELSSEYPDVSTEALAVDIGGTIGPVSYTYVLGAR